MWVENPVFRRDMEFINDADFIKWDQLEGKTVFITGATGLIGYYLVSALAYRNLYKGSHIHILALVRDWKKAEAKFEALLLEKPEVHGVQFIQGTLERFPDITERVDYIIHGGGPTASRYFVEHPVETVQSITLGTMNVLELAKKNPESRMTFLSSIEAYGRNLSDEKLKETDLNGIDPMIIRNAYPASKVLCENLCADYASEYGVQVNVVRLTQTMGPGISSDDQRVCAYFIRCIKQKHDIVLQTPGKTKHVYLYLSDAVTAILSILLLGESGHAYNAANEETYCSIYEMAQLVAKEISKGKICVNIQASSKDVGKYPPEVHLNLDTSELKKLGWKSYVGLRDMFESMMY